MKRFQSFPAVLAAALLVSPFGTSLHGAARSDGAAAKSAKSTRNSSSSTTANGAKPMSHSRSSSKQHFFSRWRRHRAPSQRAPTPDRIREIQSSLTRMGYYQGEPTGKWDSATVESMKRFQQAQGLSPTGKIDALTLQKLGLGSDVAGLSAPRPAPPPAPPPPVQHP